MRSFSLDTDKMETQSYPSCTYAIKSDCIEGNIDGIDAVKQAVEKILNTERYEYPIYSFSYGVELQKLIGKDETYVRAELKRIVSEALLQDERIQELSNFDFLFQGDICSCSFLVKSIPGVFQEKIEVTYV